ncbi:MAG: RES family NAD+ phosphorylase [Xanthobacteraceae bacterium]|nr:RES family NAD+ phosphorylase [Xanthobacteraceae bacterium]
MIHDNELLDLLSELPRGAFMGAVFRATGMSVDPTAASVNGGRWSPRPDKDWDVPTLYTSLKREGALAELCSFLADFTPVPKGRLIKVTRLDLALHEAVRLEPGDLSRLGVDMAQYGRRDYARTQLIGAALAFLGVDGLIAPSARWGCDNVMVFQNNHDTINNIVVGPDESLDWRAWAEANGFLPKTP